MSHWFPTFEVGAKVVINNPLPEHQVYQGSHAVIVENMPSDSHDALKHRIRLGIKAPLPTLFHAGELEAVPVSEPAIATEAEPVETSPSKGEFAIGQSVQVSNAVQAHRAVADWEGKVVSIKGRKVEVELMFGESPMTVDFDEDELSPASALEQITEALASLGSTARQKAEETMQQIGSEIVKTRAGKLRQTQERIAAERGQTLEQYRQEIANKRKGKQPSATKAPTATESRAPKSQPQAPTAPKARTEIRVGDHVTATRGLPLAHLPKTQRLEAGTLLVVRDTAVRYQAPHCRVHDVTDEQRGPIFDAYGNGGWWVRSKDLELQESPKGGQ